MYMYISNSVGQDIQWARIYMYMHMYMYMYMYMYVQITCTFVGSCLAAATLKAHIWK